MLSGSVQPDRIRHAPLRSHANRRASAGYSGYTLLTLGKMVNAKGYMATYYGHIESLDYRDGDGQLWLQCGCRGSRIYCDDTAKLPFSRRQRVLENLCDYYETMTNPAIVVLDQRDKDREELERVIARMSAQGHKITIQYWTAEMQEQFEQGWQLRLLRAGKKLRIDGTELGTVEDCKRWREAHRGASPKGGPRWWLAIQAFWKGRHR